MASLLGFGRAQLASAYRKRLPERDGSAAAAPRLDRPDGRSLSKLVEREIIPRLVASHPRTGRAAPQGDGANMISIEEVERFAPLSLQVEADSLLDYVESFLDRGVTIDTLLVDLLAPAARKLGEYWEQDRCDFVDVTMGLWRLQEILHELAARLPAEHRTGPGHRALFTTMAGDQHSFGTVVIEELFSREGWLTERMIDATTADLMERLVAEPFDLIGLTVTCDCHIAALPSIIGAVRSVSRNPHIQRDGGRPGLH